MKEDKKKKQIIEKLQDNSIIAHACKKVGIGRSTFYRWINADPAFKKAVKKAQVLGRENISDAAEFKILYLMNKGKEEIAFKAAKFILVTNSEKYRINNQGYQRIKLEKKIEELKNKEDKEIEETLHYLKLLIEQGKNN